MVFGIGRAAVNMQLSHYSEPRHGEPWPPVGQQRSMRRLLSATQRPSQRPNRYGSSSTTNHCSASAPAIHSATAGKAVTRSM